MDTPIFVVSIKRNQDRCHKTIVRLAEIGIQAQAWWGVDGKSPIEFQDGESVDHTSRLYHVKRGRPIPPTAVGAYLSHYRLMQHAQQNGWEKFVVFEDDIEPLPNLKQTLDEILALDQSFEHINLRPAHITSSIANGYSETWHELPSGHQVARNITRTLGFLGYVANQQYLKRVLPQLMPINDDVDAAAEAIMLQQKGRAFSLWPPALAHEGHNAIYRGPYTPHHRARRLITRWLLRKQLVEHKQQRHELEQALLQECIKEYKIKTEPTAETEAATEAKPKPKQD